MRHFKFILCFFIIYPTIAFSSEGNAWVSVDNHNITLSDRCGNGEKCSVIANTKYFAGVLNKTPTSSCALGELFIVDKSNMTYKQVDTGTCSSNAYVSKGTFPDKILESVDVVLNGERVKVYPIGQWSMAKDVKVNGMPSWDKGKPKLTAVHWVRDNIHNPNNNSSLTVKCYIDRNSQQQSIIQISYISTTTSFDNSAYSSNKLSSIEIDSKEYPVHDEKSVFEKESDWVNIIQALRSGSNITVTSINGEKGVFNAEAPMTDNIDCAYP